MKKDEIIEMAKEVYGDTNWTEASLSRLKAVIKLAVAKERNRAWAEADWTEYEHAIAAREREACAKVADGYVGADPIAEAIRARGEQA